MPEPTEVTFKNATVTLPEVKLSKKEVEWAYCHHFHCHDLYEYTKLLQKKVLKNLMKGRCGNWNQGDEQGIDKDGYWYYRFHGAGNTDPGALWDHKNNCQLKATDEDREIWDALHLIINLMYSNKM